MTRGREEAQDIQLRRQLEKQTQESLYSNTPRAIAPGPVRARRGARVSLPTRPDQARSQRTPESTLSSEVPTAVVVTRQDRLIPAWRQLELARSIPGATVHTVDGNHFAFARADVFVPTLLQACHSVTRRVTPTPASTRGAA